MKSIAITAHKKAELIDVPAFEPLKPSEVRGHTLVSLVSPGTELNWAFLSNAFPVFPGYSCVFQIEEIGSEVTDLKPGDVVFTSGSHRDFQQTAAIEAIKLPDGLAPEVAVFARLMGVSMSTLNTTAVHAPERVLVTGLGPVGNLAAQIFARCGFQVTAVDPVESRRLLAQNCGLDDVRASLVEAEDLKDKVGLHVECSGHEQAVVDGCQTVRKRGEVVLVGVPWRRRSELAAFDILHAVFRRYVILRSGWEWEIPRTETPFAGNFILSNYAAAIRWLAEKTIRTEGLAQSYAPSQAQEVYSGLLAQTLPTPAACFDWRK